MNSFISLWSRSTWQVFWHRKHSMHLRNSCTRSMSAWAMRQVPSAASGGRGLNFLIFFLASKFHDTSHTRSLTTGNARIGSTVIGSSDRQLAHARHAHQPRHAVDLGGAGAALAGLAVPADGQVAGLLGLDLVNDVEHDHAGAGLGRVVDVLAFLSGRRARCAE